MATLMHTNLYTAPSFETGGTTLEVRRNYATNPAGTATTLVAGQLGWSARWFGSGVAGTQLQITGAGDGPAGTGITSYRRKRWDAAAAGNGDTGYALALGNAVGGTSTEGFPVTPGDTYTVSAYMRATSAGSKTGGLQYVLRDAAGAYIGIFGDSSTALTLGQWQRFSFTYTVATGVAYISPILDVDGGTAWANGDTLDGTGLLVEKVSTLGTYFDGSTAVSGDHSHSWVGTADSSQSIQTVVQIPGLSQFTGRQVFQSSLWAAAGTKSLRIVPTGLASDSANGALVFTATSGKTYTVLATCRLAAPQTGTLDTKARRIHDLATATMSSQAPNTAGAHELRWTFTATSGSAIRLANGASSGNGDVWWDKVAIIEVPSASEPYTGPYFDGSTLPDGGRSYAWTGTANASTSTASSLDLPEQTLPAPHGATVANNSKALLRIKYRSGWTG